MFVKIEREDCQVYFVNDNPQLSSRWGCELDLVQLHEFRKAENEFWHWQEVLEQGIKRKVKPSTLRSVRKCAKQMKQHQQTKD